MAVAVALLLMAAVDPLTDKMYVPAGMPAPLTDAPGTSPINPDRAVKFGLPVAVVPVTPVVGANRLEGPNTAGMEKLAVGIAAASVVIFTLIN